MSPGEILKECHERGISKLALTDINSTAGILQLKRESVKYGVEPVAGIDFRNGNQQLFVAIAKNLKGFYEINDYLSKHLHAKEDVPKRAPDWENVFVIYPVKGFSLFQLKPYEYLGVSINDLNKYHFFALDKKLFQKCVVLQPMTFRNKRDYNTHRLLRAIDINTLLSKVPKSEEGLLTDTFLSLEEIQEHYQHYPELIKNTEALLEQCSFDMPFETLKNQKTYTGSIREDRELILKLSHQNIPYRYGKVTKNIQARIEKELNTIIEKNFVSYFLINKDIVDYARSKGYFYVGRGSGANSIIAYLLGITDVDPIELDLYFERFINLYRTSPPDFDIDFSSRDRDDVTDYIFKRFPNTALLATYNTFQERAARRELGKVFGLPAHEIDQLAERGLPKDDLGKLVLRYGKQIHGLPSHLSIHAGGILISEEPIHQYTATHLPPKGFPTTMFDMHIAEDIGLYKFDILAQRGLGKIKETLEIIQYNRPEDPPIDIHDIPKFKQDPKIKFLLKKAKAIGCFYVESPAMRMLLTKLQVDSYLGLVAASSVIRPGVAKSGMMREYIQRFRYPEKRKNAHPILLDIMPDTFGVMVYQEDVIKVAHHFAGLDLGEADVLRRGMSGKYRSREEFVKVRNTFFNNCKQRGIDERTTADVWRQIESFAGYAFAKGHSASYAVESYQSLFLKAYYPLEYMVAVLNHGGGFYSREFYIHEARMHGATIEAPCIVYSTYYNYIRDKTIYLGFGIIKELETETVRQIIDERVNGNYIDFQDFTDRVKISLEQIKILIKIGAFRQFNPNKKDLLWKAHLIFGKRKQVVERSLFKVAHKEFVIPQLSYEPLEEAFDQLEMLGFSLFNPFGLLKESITNKTLVADLPKNVGKEIEIYGYLVTVKKTSTSNGQQMFFGTFLDQEGYFIDTTHFPDVAAQYPFRGKGIYKIQGLVAEEFECYSIEVSHIEKCPFKDDPRYI
jgi:error-prone DNA polymerase